MGKWVVFRKYFQKNGFFRCFLGKSSCQPAGYLIIFSACGVGGGVLSGKTLAFGNGDECCGVDSHQWTERHAVNERTRWNESVDVVGWTGVYLVTSIYS